MSGRPKALTTVWVLRMDDLGTYVRAVNESIQVFRDDRSALLLSRADARLLAKRINQCLDETRKP